VNGSRSSSERSSFFRRFAWVVTKLCKSSCRPNVKFSEQKRVETWRVVGCRWSWFECRRGYSSKFPRRYLGDAKSLLALLSRSRSRPFNLNTTL